MRKLIVSIWGILRAISRAFSRRACASSSLPALINWKVDFSESGVLQLQQAEALACQGSLLIVVGSSDECELIAQALRELVQPRAVSAR